MKKLLVVLMSLCLVAAGGCSEEKRERVRIYNWGEYISDDVITAFEDEYNVDVVYTTFDSNEMMYTMLQKGETYDVLIPSDYMIQRLIEQDMLQTIDTSKIENYDGIVSDLIGQSYDPEGEYSVPYFWGNVGLVYNKNNVSAADLESQGWGILKNPEYDGRIFAYNSERDSFMMALKNLGYSMNSTSEVEIKEASEWLIEMSEAANPIYGNDEIIDSMISGTKDIAVMYSGDSTYIISENPDMDYFVPNEGTNIWTDAMVVPKNAENVDLAYKWISFMLRPEYAYMNSEAVGYTSSVQEVIDQITASEGAYYGISSYVPRLGYGKDEYFVYNRSIADIMSQYWSDVIVH